MTVQYFVKPYDIFMPRGNSHWGVNSGDFGKIKMLPSPSLFAGAFRSKIASTNLKVFSDISKGKMPSESSYAKVLGSLDETGTFRIKNVILARRLESNQYEPIISMPADVTVFDDDVRMARPQLLPSIVKAGHELPMCAIMKAPQKKPVGSYYLNYNGISKYLCGDMLDISCLIGQNNLWESEMRVGIALNCDTRATEEGKIYTAEAISFCDDIGFIVGIEGSDDLLGDKGTVVLGGDQRPADYCKIDFIFPKIDLNKIEQSKKFKLILNTQAIFEKGWIPNGISFENGEFTLNYNGLKARLVCAAINGYETISGWNMVANLPKPAIKMVPAGSVYWFDNLEGNIAGLSEYLENGICFSSCDMPDKQRVVEGFNKAFVAEFK